jgi:hypothetical protein
VALAGIHMPASMLMGRPPSARMTFYEPLKNEVLLTEQMNGNELN